MYISEIAPPQYRGKMMQAQRFGNFAFILVDFIIGIPSLLGSADRWFYMFYLSVPLVLLQFVAYFFVFESPKHLYLNRRDEAAARDTLHRLYNGLDTAVDDVLAKFDREAEQANKRVSLLQILKTPHLRTCFTLASCLFLTQTTSGSQVFNQYAKGLYETQLNLPNESASYIQVGTGCLSMACAFVAYHITDRIGRRPLVLSGLTGSCLIGTALALVNRLGGDSKAAIWSSIVLTTLIICILPLCLSAPSAYMAQELTPHAAKPIVTSVGVLFSMAANVAYFFAFPVLQKLIGMYCVLILIVVPCCLIGAYLFMELPETKLRTVDDVVESIMMKRYGSRRVDEAKY